MSDINPFEPQSHPPAPQGTLPSRSLPMGVTIIAVICLIMGILNALGICVTIPGLFPDLMSGFQPNEEAKEAARNAASAQFVTNLVQVIFSVILAPLMIVSAIGALLSKPWGRKFLIGSLIGFVVWGLFGLGNMIFTILFRSEMLLEQAKAGQNGGGPQPFSDDSLQGIMIGTMAVVGFFILAFIIFYIFSIIYLRQRDVVSYFESRESVSNK